MARQQHRSVPRPQGRAQEVRGGVVQVVRGFVEQQHAGIRAQGTGDLEHALLTQREAAGAAVQAIAETDPLGRTTRFAYDAAGRMSKRVDATGAEAVVTDGPFTESKEYLGGFWLIEAADLDEALTWATEGSAACGGRVEVRPFQSV